MFACRMSVEKRRFWVKVEAESLRRNRTPEGAV